MNSATERSSSTRVLFIANGNGEDSIAAAIAQKLPDHFVKHAFPIVGSGNAYRDICELVGPRAEVPSEGWRHTSGSVARDIKGGMLSSIWPAIRFLRQARTQYDQIVAVGDLVSPLLCFMAGLHIDIYLDVFKSGYAHRYNFFERWLFSRVVAKTYCRDDMLAKTLRQSGADAVSAGNIMLDTVPRGTYAMARKRKHATAVTLLPGSRVWAGDSLVLQVAALKKLPEALRPDIFVAVAGGISIEDLAAKTSMKHTPSKSKNPADLGQLTDDDLTLHLATGVIGNLIDGSDIVLSQAGTATQQALGMGKPVITFNRADNRPKRMRDEQALMGEARILTSPDSAALNNAIAELLSSADKRQHLGEIGRERLGGPGTLDAVIKDLADQA